MKKSLRSLLVAMALLSASGASAQFNYDFSVQTGQPFNHLTTAPIIDSPAYNDFFFLFTMPFTAELDRKVLDTAWVITENAVFNTLQEQFVSAFVFTDADLADKGSFDSTLSQSPLRIETTGTAPNRIFKLEFANVGFLDEWNLYGTRNDSANIQVWVYETSNIIELRYGASNVTHFTDYFEPGGMQAGLLHDLDIVNGGGTVYFLKGNPSSPTIDSADLDSPNPPAQQLSAFPANGTVYRFMPRALGIGAVTGNVSLNVFPTLTRGNLNVTYGDAGTASYRIVSLTGAQLQSGNLQSGSNMLDVSSLTPGSYVLQAKNAVGQGTFRFTKQ